MTALPRLHVPMLAPTDVIPHLGAPHHYKDGFSAKLIAETWFGTNDLPVMVRTTLGQVARFAHVELVDAFLERCVELGDGSTPSQTDLLAVLGVGNELAIMAIEGKVRESFGKYVCEWLAGAAPGSKKPDRLRQLSETLGLNPSAAGQLRYQLLHRTASAIYEAKRYRSKVAIMMVHSFDPFDAGVDDFRHFAAAIGLPDADATRLVGPVVREGVDLYLGWTADRDCDEGFTIVNGRKTDQGHYEDD